MGNPLLHQATLRGDGEMIRLLLRAAPHLDVHAGGQNGLTPLCQASKAGHVRGVELLLLEALHRLRRREHWAGGQKCATR